MVNVGKYTIPRSYSNTFCHGPSFCCCFTHILKALEILTPSQVLVVCPLMALKVRVLVVYLFWGVQSYRTSVSVFTGCRFRVLGHKNPHLKISKANLSSQIRCECKCLSRWWQLKHFSCSPRTLGKISNLTSIFLYIFQMGWFNHQPVVLLEAQRCRTPPSPPLLDASFLDASGVIRRSSIVAHII